MGRIQRKKTVPRKKKKKSIDSTASESGAKKGVLSANQAKVPREVHSGVQKEKSGFKQPKFIADSIQFLREVKVELKKVTWPSRNQTIGFTLVVILLVLIISMYLGVVDVGLSAIIRLIY